MKEIDQAWEAINALAGWVADSDIAGQSYNAAILAALKEIEKIGGMDPIKRKALEGLTEWAQIKRS
jgi:hypothetical protein